MEKWYILQSKARKEFFISEQLKFLNVHTYLPFLRVKRVNPRARKVEPYFPGYLFVRTDIDDFGSTRLQRMSGARGLVQFGNEFATLEDTYVQSLRQNIDKLNSFYLQSKNKQPNFKQGDRLIVKSGIFTGHEAIFDAQIPGSERVRLLLTWLEGRLIRVELPLANIQG